jgi:hypothetical protein
MPDLVDWLVIGDFNLYRHPDDTNRPGVDHAEMFMFNESISKLGLVELPTSPFTCTWIGFSLRLPGLWPILTLSLSMETYDHVPCLINISTNIPRFHI